MEDVTDVSLLNDSFSTYNVTSTLLSDPDFTAVNCTLLLKDKAPPPPTYGPTTRYAITGLLLIFPVLTILGNLMVIIAVLTHKRLQNITNAFVVSLALADFMVALLVMPFGLYQQINNKVWKLGTNLCLVTISFDVMFTTTSIFSLSCLAIDRYLAICKPFMHERITRKKVVMMLAFCWIVPIFISFLPITQQWNLKGDVEEYAKCAKPVTDSHCSLIVNKPFAIVCSCIAFYIPTIFIIICNVKIYLAARKQAHHIRTLEMSAHRHHRKGKLKHETKAAKTVGIIMGCFFLCWFPFFSINVVDVLIGYKITYIPWTVALWLGYINSMLNPFLYYIFNRHYKMAFRRLLNCKVCRGISEYEDTVVTSYTEMRHSSVESASANQVNNCLPNDHLNNNMDL